ncbi:exo 1,3/1,4-beta-D-glucan glucohydrolase [Pseudoalteromonas sp. Of11M-6]|uniref:glycoside hydrolase family 3 protein n=1 Tax=Pseudoalteromonas sp. Of11M-6 TaxID=2917754 RepID=UPI001EF6A53C|nr:exo 1,3/1,4-beta-D-glucan glucohydrolase [Pseudoalteromonas sp. Of11M-6]MCG7552689.1 exo 1,3/1,4-beta-D-glucan glucohydrolase [Pseudoalteromonas sp. Of11M-6]
MKTKITMLSLAMAIATLTGCSESPNKTSVDAARQVENWPALTPAIQTDDNLEERVRSILAKMTLKQKIAQMIQPEIRNITVAEMREYGFGSYLNGGGAFPYNNKHATPADWVKLAEALYQASIDDSLDGSTIPTMWGTDAVHGHNNVIGATLFPHNIGLGAANNPDLIEKIAHITAKEVLATGIDWIFAPTVAVVRDDRWGRTYEGYSEHPDIVKAYSSAIVKGLQGDPKADFLGKNRVISTVKHFVGDGGTVDGDDQGDNIASEKALIALHAQGYVGGLEAGAQSVMASFNSWHGEKVHGSHYLLTQVLKERMNFDGFVVSDWNGHGQIKGCTNDSCAEAINAGIDIVMAPNDWKALYNNTLAQAKSGAIAQSRIDDAVSRILRVKLRAGLFEKPSPANRPLAGNSEIIGAESHRKVARQAVRESLVLLKNKDQLLPLKPNQHILLAGDGADNIGKQSGGWSITWQGTNNTNADFPGATSIYDGIKQQAEAAGGTVTLSTRGDFEDKPDVAIVVFGEDPYAEGHGDRTTLEYKPSDKSDLALLKRFKQAGIPTVAVFISGRPMWVNPELNASDAFVAAWLPGSEGIGISDVLLADKNGQVQYDFTGKLSYSWPKTPTQIVNYQDKNYDPLLPYGFGLRYSDQNVLADNLPEQIQTQANLASGVDLLVRSINKPWQGHLYSSAENQVINANTHKLGGISYRTTDREVQEDAIQLLFDGSRRSGFRLASESYFREDISPSVPTDSALTFKVQVDAAPDKPVWVAMSCEGEADANGSCTAKVDIAKQLQAMPLAKWQSLSIDLNCFTAQGMDFTKTVVPFELSTAGILEVTLSEIQISSEASPTLSCN